MLDETSDVQYRWTYSPLDSTRQVFITSVSAAQLSLTTECLRWATAQREATTIGWSRTGESLPQVSLILCVSPRITRAYYHVNEYGLTDYLLLVLCGGPCPPTFQTLPQI